MKEEKPKPAPVHTPQQPPTAPAPTPVHPTQPLPQTLPLPLPLPTPKDDKTQPGGVRRPPGAGPIKGGPPPGLTPQNQVSPQRNPRIYYFVFVMYSLIFDGYSTTNTRAKTRRT